MMNKFVPIDLIKNINDIKKKVEEIDVYDTYTKLAEKYSSTHVINNHALELIKGLDKELGNKEHEMIISLNTSKN
jgi:hypothetical protein